jgi:hypothetical protein
MNFYTVSVGQRRNIKEKEKNKEKAIYTTTRDTSYKYFRYKR